MEMDGSGATDRASATAREAEPLSGEEVVRRISELINPTAYASSPTQEDWYWGRLSTGNEEDYFWRRLSDNWYNKDTIPSTYLELHNQCYEAYNANPLAFAVVEITTSFVLGKGVKVQAKNRRVQALLDGFWHDPDNRMEARVYDICTELSLYGEIFVRFFVNRFDGKVKIRLIDPSIIDQVETDPDDIETQLRFHQRPIGPSPTQNVDASNLVNPNVIRGQNPGDPTMAGKWFEAGTEVAHFAINKVSNAKRGKSDLATLLPWLRRYKDWLTDRVRINKYKGAFLWDVTLRGADLKTINARKMEYSYPPEPGSVVIHNEAEQWQAVRPEINAQEAEKDGRAIKLMVAVGATLPEHYLSDGDNNNRATATQMGLPTFLKFKRRQGIIKTILRTILDRVLLEAQRAGRLSSSIEIARAYEIVFPEFDVEDNQEMGTAISYLMQGLSTAKEAGWISNETAMKVLFKFCDLEVDLHEEAERIAADQRGNAGQARSQPQQGRAQAEQPLHAANQTQQPGESPELADKLKFQYPPADREQARVRPLLP
ncbi:MAG TPA: hypothetical protein VGD98_23285 [Ktedonobacteraceae bacterium]